MEWWQWVLSVFSGLIVFFFGAGTLTVAAYAIRAFWTFRTELGGFREELAGIRADGKIMTSIVQEGFKAGERRFDGLEGKADKHSKNIRDLEQRVFALEQNKPEGRH